jgi:hypothetical protein
MNPLDEKVFDGVRKTINRFREKPFHYFTEADLHSSLLNDMMSGGSDILAHRPGGDKKHISVSLVHQEYPTNFRYKKEDMISGYDDLQKTELGYTDENSYTFGDRGNYDLAILNPEFIFKMLENNKLERALEHLINKDNQRAISRKADSPGDFKKEVLYAIEVKFIHPFNARNKNMLYEVIKDDNKLMLAFKNSDDFVRPINLVFCSTAGLARSDDKNSVVKLVKDYIANGEVKDYNETSFSRPKNVVGIFIESFVAPASNSYSKTTSKPIFSGGKGEWIDDFRIKLKL